VSRAPRYFPSRAGSGNCVNDFPRRAVHYATDPGRAPFAREEDPIMELAAAVLFGSVVLWFIEETADQHV